MHQIGTEHNRGRRFKVALAYRATTATKWAEDHEITRGHLHKVIAGDRDSVTLLREIDAFIDEVEREMTPATRAA